MSGGDGLKGKLNNNYRRHPKEVAVVQTAEPLYGTFRSRPNRFRMEVKLDDGQMVSAHCPNPGRMEELFTGGEQVSLKKALPSTSNIKRKTTHDVLGVHYQGQWVSIDSRLPNELAAAALAAGAIREQRDWKVARPEHTWGSSRFDFLLEGEGESEGKGEGEGDNGQKGLLEVKSCTLVEGGIAIFPDAPTLRGARHLRELALAVKEGYRAWALFCIQRPDARLWQPNRAMDPDFADACLEAQAAGVQLLALACDFDGVKLTLKRRIPVETR